MMDAFKYQPGHFPLGTQHSDRVYKERIETPPTWCSVDMRGRNQSLIIPMSLEKKLEYFKILLGVGFKEIKVCFPAASATEHHTEQKAQHEFQSDSTVPR